MRKQLSFIILLLTISLTTVANKDSLNIKSKEITEVSETPKTVDNNKILSELDYYKLLYEKEQKNGNSYISLIQWIIGVCLAFLLAIIGSQIFFNYRINKKELDYIKKDLDQKLTNLKNELLEKIELKFELSETKLKEKFDKGEKVVKERVEKFIESENKMLELQLKTQKGELEREINYLKKDIEKNSGDLWKLKGVESNALSSFLRVAFMQIDLKHEVKYILDDIIEILNDLAEINNSDYNKLDELCSKLEVSNADKITRIKELYNKKPVYEFVERKHDSFDGFLGMPLMKYVKNKK